MYDDQPLLPSFPSPAQEAEQLELELVSPNPLPDADARHFDPAKNGWE